MKINFKIGSEKILHKFQWLENLIHKWYSLFFRDLPRFFKNVWIFRKSLWEFQWWDYTFALNFLQTSTEIMAHNFEKKGIELDEYRLPKVQKMRRANQLIKNVIEDNFIQQAEMELGKVIYKPFQFIQHEDMPNLTRLFLDETEEEMSHKKKIYARARDLEELQWVELWGILGGSKIYEGKISPSKAKNSKSKKNAKGLQDQKIPDGSDLRSWWD